MFKIRYKTFETNSSSTHSICICTEEDFDKYKNGNLILDRDFDELIKVPENFDKMIDEDSDEYDEEAKYRYFSYHSYRYDEYLEWYDKHFTTPSGDKMVAFGRYGHD